MPVLALWLFCAATAGASPASVQASTATVALVRLFLETPVPRLPPESVETFLAINPGTLPPKMRLPYKAKRLELYNLKQIAEGKKRGFVRTPEAECSPVPGSKGSDLQTLRAAEFSEIREEEEDYLMKKTRCTELELMCEFSLQVVAVSDPRTRKPRRYLFLHPNDPLMALVAEYRTGARGGNTPFFGKGGPVCSR